MGGRKRDWWWNKPDGYVRDKIQRALKDATSLTRTSGKMRTAEVARRLSMSITTLYRLCRRTGISLHYLGWYTDQELVDMIENAGSVNAFCRETGLCDKTVREALSKRDLNPRIVTSSGLPILRDMSDEEIRSLYRKNFYSASLVADVLGVTKDTVMKEMDRRGIRRYSMRFSEGIKHDKIKEIWRMRHKKGVRDERERREAEGGA